MRLIVTSQGSSFNAEANKAQSIPCNSHLLQRLLPKLLSLLGTLRNRSIMLLLLLLDRRCLCAAGVPPVVLATALLLLLLGAVCFRLLPRATAIAAAALQEVLMQHGTAIIFTAAAL
jgi:hypothetical protein